MVRCFLRLSAVLAIRSFVSSRHWTRGYSRRVLRSAVRLRLRRSARSTRRAAPLLRVAHTALLAHPPIRCHLRLLIRRVFRAIAQQCPPICVRVPHVLRPPLPRMWQPPSPPPPRPIHRRRSIPFRRLRRPLRWTITLSSLQTVPASSMTLPPMMTSSLVSAPPPPIVFSSSLVPFRMVHLVPPDRPANLHLPFLATRSLLRIIVLCCLRRRLQRLRSRLPRLRSRLLRLRSRLPCRLLCRLLRRLRQHRPAWNFNTSARGLSVTLHCARRLFCFRRRCRHRRLLRHGIRSSLIGLSTPRLMRHRRLHHPMRHRRLHHLMRHRRRLRHLMLRRRLCHFMHHHRRQQRLSLTLALVLQ